MSTGIRSGFFSWLLRDSNLRHLTARMAFSGVGNLSASWKRYAEYSDYARAFDQNIGVSTVIDIKATAKANVKFKLKNIDTGEFIEEDDMTSEQKNMFELLKKPNAYQSTYEFWKQFEIMKSTFGDSFWLPSLPEGTMWKPIDAYSIENINPQYMIPVYTGQIFRAQSISDLVKEYKFCYDKIKDTFKPEDIIHRNEVSIDFDPKTLTLGTSRLKSLRMAIDNIDIAFESRNVIGRHRGAQGVFSSNNKDATGTFPMQKEDKKEAQEQLDNYGTLNGQSQYIVSRHPLNYQSTTLPIKDLMLFEEVATDIMHIATKFGVPEVLVKAYLQGATFENQEASERRLYQNTIIPETEDDVIALNNYFQCSEYGFEIVASFEHVAVLQKNIKEASESTKNQNDVLQALFEKGAITYDTWLQGINQPPDDEIGDKRIWDLDEKQLNIILGTTTNTSENGTT